MLVLIAVGLVAGIITSISPCVLPVLPVVLAAGTGPPARRRTGPARHRPADRLRPRSWRPVGVVVGLVTGFTGSTLLGSMLLDTAGLPDDLLRQAGIVVVALVGLAAVFPRVGEVLGRPFARIGRRRVDPNRNGVLVGLGVGLLFVPCAGPVLATIAVLGATHRVGADAVVLTLAFGMGVGLPLLTLALAGDALLARTRALRRRARAVRIAGGVTLMLTAGLLGLNLTDGVQQLVPGYTSSLQAAVEGTDAATQHLDDLTAADRASGRPTSTGPSTPVPAAPDADPPCQEDGSTLENCGPAPNLGGIAAWLNTPAPLDLASLRGKVVLIDFWTYSCINCQRSLPHVEAWHEAYADHGLVVIGVHTPEFAFEHVPGNVAAQAAALGVHYPVAVDNRYVTWNRYQTRYWPTAYLIDAAGVIRHIHIGEGDYTGTERLIRQLLATTTAGQDLPAPTDIPDTASPSFYQTPETYLGYRHDPPISGTMPVHDRYRTYRFPAEIAPDTIALAGTWKSGPESITAGPGDAQLRLSFQADTVYIVLGGTGTVTAEVDGATTTTRVGGPPTLYRIAHRPTDTRTTLTLHAEPGVQAYDITFG